MDKVKMAEAIRSQLSKTPDELFKNQTRLAHSEVSLPPMRYSFEDAESWTTFEKPILYVSAGKGPYVSR